MPVLLTADLIIEGFLFYFLMLFVLVLSTCAVVAKNVANSILWFSAAAIGVFSMLTGIGVDIVGIISIITCMSLAASLFFMSSCYNLSKNEKQRPSYFPVYACFCTVIVSISFLMNKFPHSVVDVKNKYYDTTMYLITALLAVIILMTIFGFRVLHPRKF